MLAGFLRETDLVNPVIVGHSMGTQIVSLLAATHPDVTDRIVVLAPTMEPAARTPGRAIGRLLHDSTREPPIVFWIAITDYLVRCGLPYLVRQMPHMLTDRIEERVGTNHAQDPRRSTATVTRSCRRRGRADSARATPARRSARCTVRTSSCTPTR